MSKSFLVGGLVITHGQLGRELLLAAQTIVGEISYITAVSLGWNDDVEESKKRVEEAVRKVDQGEGVIILTDMFGGTASNISLSLLRRDQLEIITGVNLPMIIKLGSQSGTENLSKLASQVKEQGQRHISIASEVLGE